MSTGARVCPTPHKTPYRSKQAARRALRIMTRHRVDSGPGRLHAYLCVARSHWHLGHTTY